MHVHILGIGGTFMAGVAVLAKALGHHVTGSDLHVYPPMSDQLREQGIIWQEGYLPEHLMPAPDCVIVGNAMKRGIPAVEYMLNQDLNYVSGPQWLAENVLAQRWVLAVAGTHGKTTTTSMLTWILEYAGLQPGFLIGGIANNFATSARLTDSAFFVIEADEYDSAFFDKRSKFVHYHPRTLILNNLEFDHADIFADLGAIQTQFHHLIRTVPSEGRILCNALETNLETTLKKGCWTPVEYFGGDDSYWRAETLNAENSHFAVIQNNQLRGEVRWELMGSHNMQNGLAAIAAAAHAGVTPVAAIEALSQFAGVKRRLEIKARVNDITIYDDFAHHPTAIATTLAGLRKKVGKARIIAVAEMASNTMRMGVHRETLGAAFQEADRVLFARPKPIDWGIAEIAEAMPIPASVHDNVDDIVAVLVAQAQAGDHIVVMSNGGFDNIQQKLAAAW